MKRQACSSISSARREAFCDREHVVFEAITGGRICRAWRHDANHHRPGATPGGEKALSRRRAARRGRASVRVQGVRLSPAGPREVHQAPADQFKHSRF
jgi:hypothetical protein